MLLLKCELKTYTTDNIFLHLSTHYFGGRSKRELSCLEIRSSSRFLREIWISYFAQRILEGDFIRGIVNITLRGSRDLFVPHCDSFPMNREKRHSFLKLTRSKKRFCFNNFNFILTLYVTWKETYVSVFQVGTSVTAWHICCKGNCPLQKPSPRPCRSNARTFCIYSNTSYQKSILILLYFVPLSTSQSVSVFRRAR